MAAPGAAQIPSSLAVDCALSTTGEYLYVGSWPWSASYNGDGTMAYEETTDGTSTWRRTYTYASGRVTTITGWVKQ